jgi:Tol biopolymer transport system component
VAIFFAVLGCGKSSSDDKPSDKTEPASAPARTATPAAGASSPLANAPVAPDLAPPGLLYVCHQNEREVGWCAVDITTSEVKKVADYGDVGISEPALSRAHSTVIFAVKHPTHPRLIGSVRGKAFESKLPANQELQVYHPSISRDGKLLAFSIRSSKHVGNIDIYDWDTGAYDSTFTAVATWYKIVSVNLETGKQQAVYYDDDLVPDVMRNRGLGPVFSPTEDILVFADSRTIYVADASSGKELRKFPAPQLSSGGWTGLALVSSYSGMAFTPDGKYIAYLSAGEAEIDVGPSWIVFMDIQSGAATHVDIPQGNSAWTSYGRIGLDFSPDGRYLAFSAGATSASGDLTGPFLGLFDIENRSFHSVDAAGRASHPVWKGR